MKILPNIRRETKEPGIQVLVILQTITEKQQQLMCLSSFCETEFDNELFRELHTEKAGKRFTWKYCQK
jgi:hypothetical protein